MVDEGFALLGDGWGEDFGGWVREQLGCVLENPGISDGSAGDPDHIDASLAVHSDGVGGGEDVAAAEDGFCWITAFQVGEEWPSGGAEIFLLHCPGVDAGGCEAEGPRGFDNFEKAIFGFGRIVEARGGG